jgi:hypothetical protein
MPFRIVPVVEGHGEVRAVPELFRRIIAELNLGVPIDIRYPVRQSRDKLLKDGELERAVRIAAIEVAEEGAILILIDSEGDCPAQLGPALLARARTARTDQRISVVLAHQEFEAWFLASASSLKGQRALGDDIEDHPTPESVRGCKQWLGAQMPATSKYSPTTDQAAIAATFDMQIARQNAPSFDKLWREFEAIGQYARSVMIES